MSTLTGTGRLIRLALRRDRIMLAVWVVLIAFLTWTVIASITAVYTDAGERFAGANLNASNVMSRVMDGPASGTSLGAMSMVEAYVVLAIFTGLMAAQAVARHTRQDEETGRAELIGSAVVGRHARLTAALVVATGASLVVGGAVTAVLLANDLGVEGSIAGGATIVGIGVAFAAIAGVAAQVMTTQRGANALSGAALGAAFLFRGIGDAFGTVAPSGVELVSAWPSWLSPIGWGQQVRPFHQNNWGLFGLFGALTIVLVAVAFFLTNRRDLGAGLVAERRGREVAATGLLTPLGLAWRLQRGILLAWILGLAVFGGGFGAVGVEADDFADLSDNFREILEQMGQGAAFVDLLFTFLMAFIGVAVAGYTVQALLRMRSEEASGRLEPLLSTAVSRRAWLGGHVLIAGLGTVAILVATGLSGAWGYTLAGGEFSVGAGMIEAAVAQIPAVLTLGGFVVAVFGLVPRWAAAISWMALAVSLVMGQLGGLLKLPQWLLNVSPFTHAPLVPAQEWSLMPIVVLLGVAALLAALGFRAFRRRDLALSA